MVGRRLAYSAVSLTVGMAIVDPCRLIMSATFIRQARKAHPELFTVDQAEFDAYIDQLAKEMN